MATRRAVLQAGALAPLLVGCAPGVFRDRPDVVRIAVPWSGTELAAFRAVLEGIRAPAPGVPAYPHPVDVVPLGDDVDTALHAGGRTAPDVVMLPEAGQVRELAGTRLRAVGDSLWVTTDGRPRYRPPWWELLRHRVPGTDAIGQYGVPFKASNKSLVWYDRDAFGDSDSPRTWMLADWPDRIGAYARGERRLFALGAADGWVLTDVFANVLRTMAPRDYEDLITPPGNAGEQVREWDRPGVRAAFGVLGQIWGHPDAFAGRVAETLRRQFADSVRDVFLHRRAAMVVAPDFAEPVVRHSLRRTGRSDSCVGVMAFPAFGREYVAPRIGGGDVMVITAKAKERAEDLVAALAAPTAPVPWITRYGGFVAPDERPRAEPGREPESERGTERPASYSGIYKDVADQMNSWDVFGFADWLGPIGRRNGLWRVLTNFLVAVGYRSPGRIDEATGAAIAGLSAFERSLR
ncbi:ABC transporter substrate-binding protein [Nocardia wallacei]|uniref:ABC transporter substrate-binding protein n=1 Tax=Nocardia wallacei TaxID=480035 RepID=UPI00245566F3|nr:ABC transporter substrate-binding protein [Nocardia wallacei]